MHDPVATREVHDRIAPGKVTLSEVQYEVRAKATDPKDLWLIDVTVRVAAELGGIRVSPNEPGLCQEF